MNTPLISRRSLLIGSVGVITLLGLGGATKYAWATDRHMLRPPGGQDESYLISTCIRCDRCRQACPMNAIKSADIEDGLINTRTPKLNYRSSSVERTLGTTAYHQTETGYCNFCDPDLRGNQVKKCIANCPTGALKAFDERVEKIGIAEVDPVYCINFPQIGQTPTGCRLCIDACDYGAIIMNDEQRPEVIADKCNGCGKCELICPSASYRQVIGISTLEEKAGEGLGQYAKSYEYYQQTGSIPRGINVRISNKSTTA